MTQPEKSATGVLQELLGCEWGRRIATPDDTEKCSDRAANIVVVHEGDAEASFKLCSRHRDRALAETTARGPEMAHG